MRPLPAELQCEIRRCRREQRVHGWCRKHAKWEADRLFATFVKRRDRFCVGCGGRAEQCMHGLSRRYFSTRWLQENAWAGCAACHMRWTHDPLGWRDWMRERMGSDALEALELRARMGGMPDLGLVISEYRRRCEELAA